MTRSLTSRSFALAMMLAALSIPSGSAADVVRRWPATPPTAPPTRAPSSEVTAVSTRDDRNALFVFGGLFLTVTITCAVLASRRTGPRDE